MGKIKSGAALRNLTHLVVDTPAGSRSWLSVVTLYSHRSQKHLVTFKIHSK